MKLYVGIPMYNAEKTIQSVIEGCKKQNVHQIIVLDDKSTDNSYNIIKKINGIKIIQHNQNRGYGGAQKTLYDEFIKICDAPDDVIILVHSDGQTYPEEIPRFAKAFSDPNVDVVLGSRALGNMRAGKMPYYKIWGDRCLTAIQNWCYGGKLSTYSSGYRAFRCRALRRVNYAKYDNRHIFDSDMLKGCIMANLNMAEVPVSTYYGGEESHYALLEHVFTVTFNAIIYKFKKLLK